MTYSGILGEVVDRSKIAWMMAEARQSTNAAEQFASSFAIAAMKTVLVLILLTAARHFLRPSIQPYLVRVQLNNAAAMLISVAALLGYAFIPFSLSGAVANERNAFVYAA